MQTCIYR